jgi:glycosyltransferase involved in cell wall biosynthesis
LQTLRTVRVCLVFDCLYPYTVGGAERWYRNLAERLAAAGHDVTYLTIRQWEGEADVPGVEVIPVTRPLELYTGGRRSIWTQVVFSTAVFGHLVRRGRRYDVVHTTGLHLFLLAVLSAQRIGQFRVVADWFEVWTLDYWREYVGPLRGRIAWLIQRQGARARHRAICFAHLHARRLKQLGFRGEPVILGGAYTGDLSRPKPREAEPVVVYAGRHIPEKQVPALVSALAVAREQAPELSATIFGDGPERPTVLRLIDELGLDGTVIAPGFVDQDRLYQALGSALCLVLPSRREGYGLVVVEACAAGTPVVVIAGPDNAAAELVDDGVNGVFATSAAAPDLAAAILRVRAAGLSLRESTADWFARNADRLSLQSSLRRVLAVYEEP